MLLDRIILFLPAIERSFAEEAYGIIRIRLIRIIVETCMRQL